MIPKSRYPQAAPKIASPDACFTRRHGESCTRQTQRRAATKCDPTRSSGPAAAHAVAHPNAKRRPAERDRECGAPSSKTSSSTAAISNEKKTRTSLPRQTIRGDVSSPTASNSEATSTAANRQRCRSGSDWACLRSSVHSRSFQSATSRTRGYELNSVVPAGQGIRSMRSLSGGVVMSSICRPVTRRRPGTRSLPISEWDRHRIAAIVPSRKPRVSVRKPASPSPAAGRDRVPGPRWSRRPCCQSC